MLEEYHKWVSVSLLESPPLRLSYYVGSANDIKKHDIVLVTYGTLQKQHKSGTSALFAQQTQFYRCVFGQFTMTLGTHIF